MSPAIPQERPLIDRMREAVPELQWKGEYGCVVAKIADKMVVCAGPSRLNCWLSEIDPHAVRMAYPGDDEAVRIVREWWNKTHEKAETMTPEYRQFIDKVSEFVEAKWSLKDGDLICEARGRVYTINHKDGKYTLRSTIDSALWVVVGVSTLDRAVASLRHRMFQPTVKERKESLALGIRHYLPGGVISENGSHSWFAVDYNGARVAVTIDDRYTVRVRGHALGVSTDSEEGAIRLIRDTLLAEAQNYNTLSEAKRIEHEMREAAAKSIVVNATVFDPAPTPVQSDTQRNDVIATFMAGTRAMQGILDVEGIDGDLLQIVGQMDQYHVLNLTDPRTRKKHVIAYDGQWYLDGEPIIFDELLNEVLAIVTLEEEQEEPMSTRRTRAELVMDGAYLGAAKTAADNARDAVAASLASGLPAEKQENARGVIADLLRTKAGSGAVAWLLGEAIRQLPDPGAKAEKFADSLMIVGAMQGTEQALDAVVEQLKALVSGVVESLPEPEKVRAVADESQEEAHEAPRRKLHEVLR